MAIKKEDDICQMDGCTNKVYAVVTWFHGRDKVWKRVCHEHHGELKEHGVSTLLIVGR